MKYGTIKVEYEDHMGSDLSVVNAARASFDKRSEYLPGHVLKTADVGLINFLARGYKTQEWDELAEKFLELENKADVQSLLKQYKASAVHFAPFCHTAVTLRLDIPVFVARQLVKHQIGGTWSEVSRRYVSDEPEFWFPSEWHTRPDDVKQGSGGLVPNQWEIEELAEETCDKALRTYTILLNRGVAPEEARIILPLNHMTTVVWTGSLLFWSRVGNQRLDPHAQTATREAADGIRKIVQPLFPVSWDALVAF